ncbi:MAG TPA: ABC transporter ATP-binding protein [Candidatus Polarisedimenticolia bacterium]|nr:ABC transporter ATP-binding protein [Candidatus Polarisedimenticolia bacterium]
MSGGAPPGPEATSAALRARSLGKRYGSFPALDRIDLEIPAGQFVLLLGPNGAGKSTLLRLFATLIRPTSGEVLIHGAPAAGEEAAGLRRRIGLLSHHTFLYDHLTGRENLLFYARLYGLPDPGRAARDALRAVGLEERSEDLVRTYSRGMQQRLAIARASLHAPDILLLDEPFTGLDREATDRLQDNLRRAREARRTCVMATHDFAAGVPLADRVVILRAGRVALDRAAAGLDAAAVETLFRNTTRPVAEGVERSWTT